MCSKCMPSAHGGQKKAPDPLELKLQMVVSRHIGSGNQIPILLTTKPSHKLLVLLLNVITRARVVKSIYCFSKEPEFDSSISIMANNQL